MHCKEEELVLKAHGRLRGLAAWRTNRHLSHCASCQKELARLETLGASLRVLTAQSPSEALDARVQSIRREKEYRGMRLPILRLPAPLVGAALGLLLGGAMTQRMHERPAEARSTLTFTEATPDFPNLAPSLLGYHLPQDNSLDSEGATESISLKTKLVSKWTGQLKIGGTVTLKISAKDAQKAQSQLEAWILSIKKAQAPEVFASTSHLGKFQENHTPILLSRTTSSMWSNSRKQLLSFAVIGFLLGFMYLGLRLLGPWIPGGFIGCIIAGCSLGYGVTYLLGGRIQNQYDARGVLKITRSDGYLANNILEDRFIFNIIGQNSSINTVRTYSGIRSGCKSLDPTGMFQLSQTLPDKAASVEATEEWLANVTKAKIWKVLGYKVQKTSPVTVVTEPLRDKPSFVIGMVMGLVAGVVMGLSRKRD